MNADKEPKVIGTCNEGVMVPLDSLTPFDQNPRKLSEKGKAYLIKSIEARGCYKPLLVWKKTLQVLGGNQRLMLMKEMVDAGLWTLPEVPVVWFDGTRKQAMQLVADDNNNAGQWDFDALPGFLKAIEAEPDFTIGDLELTGFEVPELDFMKGMDTPYPGFGHQDPTNQPREGGTRGDGTKTVQLKIPSAKLKAWEDVAHEAKRHGAKTAWDIVEWLIGRQTTQ